MAEWKDFFIAVVGASAALTGLIFVGVSISLSKILAMRGLINRALVSLILLLNVLCMSLFFLIPGQSITVLGIEILGLSIFVWLFVCRFDFQNMYKIEAKYKFRYILNLLIDQTATICFILAGISILSGWDSGAYWIAPAIIISIIKAVLDGWVLLVEIYR